METEIIDEELEEEKKKSPLWYIIAVFLLLIIVLMVFPYYAVKTDPWPTRTPAINEVFQSQDFVNNTKHKAVSFNDYLQLVNASDPRIKQIAGKVAILSCENSEKICQAKAEFYFVRNNIKYLSEKDDYVESPLETLSVGGADCDGHAVLLANLMESIGIPTRFVFIPGHVYIEAYISDAPKKYIDNNGWINLDATCKNCEFGEIPSENVNKEKEYVG